MEYCNDNSDLFDAMVSFAERSGVTYDTEQKEKARKICYCVGEFLSSLDDRIGEDLIEVKFLNSENYSRIVLRREDGFTIKKASRKEFERIIELAEYVSFLPSGKNSDPHTDIVFSFKKDLR